MLGVLYFLKLILFCQTRYYLLNRMQIDVLCMSYHFTVILVSMCNSHFIQYKLWCLRRILCHLYYDHIYTCANLFNVLFQCECHCFYSCRIIAVSQLRFLVLFVPTLNKLYLNLSYLILSYIVSWWPYRDMYRIVGKMYRCTPNVWGIWRYEWLCYKVRGIVCLIEFYRSVHN